MVGSSFSIQAPPPLRWYISDDGSSVGSLEILRSFGSRYPFIRLSEKPRRDGRNWASKDRAVNASYQLARAELGEGFDFVGVQDGDMTIEEGFFARLLSAAA